MGTIYTGVGLVTLATLLFELLLTRIFSVTLYYHFAFLVISVALFGLGLSGVMLYLRPHRVAPGQLRGNLARYCRAFALSGVVSLIYVVNHSIAGNALDPLQRAQFDWQKFFQLAFIYVLSALPFYFGGMVVSLALYHLRRHAATVYFFDLLGASLACLLLDPLLRLLGGPSAVLAALLLVAVAALLFEISGRGEPNGPARRRPSRRSWAVLGGLTALFLLNLAFAPIRIGSVKLVHNQRLAFSKWNAMSRVEVQESKGEAPDMSIDAMARTVLASRTHPTKRPAFEAVAGLVHAIRPRGSMLIIGPGGGIDVLRALRAGHDPIWLAEINPTILFDVMLDRYRDWTGNLYGQPQIRPRLAEGRHFVRVSPRRYEVIQATLVDTWAAAASGAFSLSENHLYTVEAFEDYLDHLTDSGIVTMSRWVGVPGMEFVRLAAVARTALERRGVKQPGRHVFAAYSGTLATLIVKPKPLSKGELDKLHAACDKKHFHVLYSPERKLANPVWHVLASADPRAIYDGLNVDIRPVYDDRPFFFYSVKPERLWSQLASWQQLGLNSFALQVLVGVFSLVALLVLGAIVIPLLLTRRDQLRNARGSKLRDLGFFICLGVGFIVVEIALLQRFTLLLGHPIHALRVVLFSMLLFSGIGSLLSGRVRGARALTWQLLVACAGTVVVLAVYGATLGPLLRHAVGWPEWQRTGLAIGLVAIPATMMGTLLPTGLRLVDHRHHEIIPWAWGLNGAASVMGSVLAMLLAVHIGFTAVLLSGATVYALAMLLALRRIPPTSPERSTATPPPS